MSAVLPSLVVARASGAFVTREEAIDACLRRVMLWTDRLDLLAADVRIEFRIGYRALTDSEYRRLGAPM